MEETVCLWPDGVWCYMEDLEEFLNPPCAKSDDFRILDVPEDVDDVEEWIATQEA